MSVQPGWRRTLLQVAGLSLALVIWTGVTGTGLVAPEVLPGPIQVGRYFVSAAWWADVFRLTLLTVQSALVAIMLATLFGVTGGVIIGSSEAIYRSLRVPVEFLRAIPPIALIPIVVLNYGQSATSARTLAVFGAVWPILVQTIYGVRAVDPNLKDVAKAYGITRAAVLFHIVIPSAMPFIMTGFVLSSAIALIAIVAAEIIVGIPGLGADINMARAGGVTDAAYALTIWTSILGLALAKGVEAIRRYMLRWQPSAKSGGQQ
jgi:ABC-type nitrate/sulfonate/bicarbonate transport system permease component